MGWQLVPTGIGWRAFNKTLEEGRFACGNPRCRGRVAQTQPYRLRRSKNWFTVLFIPIIPLNVKGVYVECRECKSVFHASVLNPTAASDPVDAEPSSAASMPAGGRATPGFQSAPRIETSSPVEPVPSSPLSVPSPSSAPPDVSWDAAPVVRLVFDGGGSVTIVGRDPAPVGAYRDAALCRLDDPTMTMSKTHAAFGVDASGVWVDDLGGANGVRISVPSEPDLVLRSKRATVPTGATVSLGERALQIAES